MCAKVTKYFESISLSMPVWVFQEANAKIELKVLRGFLEEMLTEKKRREITGVGRVVDSDSNMTPL